MAPEKRKQHHLQELVLSVTVNFKETNVSCVSHLLPSSDIRYVTLVWALPTSRAIFLVVGSDKKLSHMVSNCNYIHFHFKFLNQSRAAKVINGESEDYLYLSVVTKASQLCLPMNLDWWL